MPRPVWTGTLAVGMLTIQTRATRAASEPHKIPTKTYDRRDLAPITNTKTNSRTGEPVPPDEIAHGIETKTDQFDGRQYATTVHLIEPHTLPTAPHEGKVLTVEGFTPAGSIDRRGYRTVYDITADPTQPHAINALAIIAQAMHAENVAAYGTWHYRQKARLAVIEPAGATVTLAEYAWPDELHTAPDVTAAPDPLMVDQARHLIAAMSADWHHHDHPDEHHAAQLAALEAVTRGERPPLALVTTAPDPAGDLMGTLLASVEQTRAARTA